MLKVIYFKSKHASILNYCLTIQGSILFNPWIYFFSIPPKALRILPTIPLRFSFFSTNLKHAGHKACKLTGRLSFKEPLMCSKCGWTPALNFTEHFWHRWWALSNTVCLMLIVRCSYLLLSILPSEVPPPKNDNI